VEDNRIVTTTIQPPQRKTLQRFVPLFVRLNTTCKLFLWRCFDDGLKNDNDVDDDEGTKRTNRCEAYKYEMLMFLWRCFEDGSTNDKNAQIVAKSKETKCK